jgi:tripartite ATP-independent transporter DctM subunit
MPWYEIIGLMMGSVAALMLLGVPVAFAFLGINILGAMILMGGLDGLALVVANASNRVTTFTLTPIPLFMLMGHLFFRTGLAGRVFDAFDLLLGRLPGRLAFLTVGGGTFFSALTGSSLANTAMLGTLLMPDMLRRGYKPYMAMGPIMGTGGLAMIIPPSGLAVLLGSIGNINIGGLLIGGLLPGLLLAGFYATMIYTQVKLDPDAAPRYETENVSAGAKVLAIMVNVVPMGLVIFSVVGLILLGWATPTEAAAFGAASVVVLAAAFRCLTWDAWVLSLEGSVRTSGMLFLIIIGSSTFSQILAYSGATPELISWATGLGVSSTMLLVVMFVVLLFLGMFMEQASMLMLTVPIFIPLAQSLGVDLVWFGIVILLGLEMSLTTPPLGLLLFVMLGVAPPGTSLWQVARAALPFLACDAVLVALLILFPQIVLYLPSSMN